jgi:hypothetical protein
MATFEVKTFGELIKSAWHTPLNESLARLHRVARPNLTDIQRHFF